MADIKENPILDLGSKLTVVGDNTQPIENVYDNNNKTLYENALTLSSDALGIVNLYTRSLAFTTAIISGKANKKPEKENNKEPNKQMLYDTISTASLFNPYHAVQTVGVTPGVPLLDTSKHRDDIYAIKHKHPNKTNIADEKNVLRRQLFLNDKWDDCSIANLVKLSNQFYSPLGNAKYKYADFMFCRDVGKISNNHMITLRRFKTAVGDNIFGPTALKDAASNIESAGDVGRLITWFGTDDNKLEDILKYTYKATWKELEAKIQTLPSEETSPARGIVGGLVNLFNPKYNQATASGLAPSALGLILGTGGSDAFLDSAPYHGNPAVDGTNYDKNKVYETKDSVRSTHIYDGKLEFAHSFTLVFNYKLRGYDNINAKSAFLDLLGNILTVTYKSGVFWPGEQRITGAPQSVAGWNKAQKLQDQALDGAGLAISSLLSGDVSGAKDILMSTASSILGSLGLPCDSLESFLGGVKNKIKNMMTQGKGIDAVKGLMKNAMGRPAVYAFDSLLSNDAVGTWHVTIGNPLNPIMVMGNLIIDNCELSHSGPLGLDDFPTDLKVTITLKHATPRDSVDIQRMYTQGRTAIYSKITNTMNIPLKVFNEGNSNIQSIGSSTVQAQADAYIAAAKAAEEKERLEKQNTSGNSGGGENPEPDYPVNDMVKISLQQISELNNKLERASNVYQGYFGDCEYSRVLFKNYEYKS